MVQRAMPGGQWTPPLAQDWNSIGEATEVYHREERASTGPQKKQWILPTEWMFCRNDSGQDRAAGEVLEAGDYLLDEFDPFSLWFEGVAPTSPVRKSTHGVLRVACKADKLERVQVSGIVRALVNVSNTDHHFCDAAVASHVLASNDRGPHKIVYKPAGTGELECAVLLYADNREDLLAECYALTDHCPDDLGGTGTGSEGQTVSVYDFRIQPYGTLVTPAPTVTNPRNHRWPAGSLLRCQRQVDSNGNETWRVDDVELRKICMVNGIKKLSSSGTGGADESGVVKFGSVPIGAEWCPADDTGLACQLFTYGPCDGVVGSQNLSWTILVGDCCDE